LHLERAPQSAGGLPAELRSFVAELHSACAADKYGVTCDDLDQMLGAVVVKHAPGADSTQIREFCRTLRLEELVLARACAAGNEHAWEVFLTRYREKLYDAGRQIARDDSAGRELADSLYAELYGVSSREGKRFSKLSSYTGRGSLEGWLRTVMAQEHVNRYRKQKRLVSLDEECESGEQFAASEPEPARAVDPRLTAATDGALSGLPAQDRFVLAAYYLDGRTLAEIARLLSVHESTISRKLDKLAKLLKKEIITALVRQGMSRREAEEALEVDVRDLNVKVRDRLAQDSPPSSFSKKKVEAPAGDGSG
jgi:RNA polymerase sigma-70 factor (ECF subfamily)